MPAERPSRLMKPMMMGMDMSSVSLMSAGGMVLLSTEEKTATTQTPSLFPAQQWYADLHGDGFGDPSVAITACVQPSNTVRDNTDCDDANANHFPGPGDMDSDGDAERPLQIR